MSGAGEDDFLSQDIRHYTNQWGLPEMKDEKKMRNWINKIHCGDSLKVLKQMPDNFVDMVMTSPPYWQQRDYGAAGQLGQESSFFEYTDKLCNIFDEIKRVLKDTGSCYVVIDDTYGTISGNIKQGNIGTNKIQYTGKIPHYNKKQVIHKSLCLIPERFMIAMQDRGWLVRNLIIWWRRNAMPESMKDRFTNDYEFIPFFTKTDDYYFEQQLEKSTWAEIDNRSKIKGGVESKGKCQTKQYSISKVAYREDGMRNKRCVWDIVTESSYEKHYATYPESLCDIPIKASCPPGSIILDPFCGTGTTCLQAKVLGRKYIGIDINSKNVNISERRIHNEAGLL